ncbi:hypothetical protein HU200_027166 [Digitaria exilis]|uniref:Uncharacterized protein n=1 Tax=Digitaria exilis TaxID=1010633 RepID=A0A835C885_9POAL|nr:hypothetical protein HU200_027166 [Digitaria exilis]
MIEHVRLLLDVKLHRVTVDAASPGSVVGFSRRLDALPHDTAAVYAGAEGDHAHSVTLPHPSLGLDVGELVQQRATRHVAKPVQRHVRRLHVPVRKAEPLLHLVEHPTPTRVDAKVLERLAKRRAVNLPLHAQNFVPEKGERDTEELRDRQHGRAERDDVALERVRCGHGKVLGEVDPRDPLLVLLLERAPVVHVLRRRQRAHDRAEPEPGTFGRVGHDHGRRAHAEQHVGHEHLALGARVEQGREELGGHDQDVGTRMRHAEEIPGEADADERPAAAHPGEVHAAHVGTELVPVHDYVGELGCQGGEAAGEDERVDVAGAHAAPGERLVDGGEDDQLGLLAGGVDAAVGRDEAEGVGHARLLADAGLVVQAHHEFDALVVDEVGEVAPVLQGHGERDPVAWRAQEAAVLHEVHVTRAASTPQHGHPGY